MEGGQSVDREMRGSIGIGFESVVTTHIKVVAMVDVMGSDPFCLFVRDLVMGASCIGTPSHFTHVDSSNCSFGAKG